MIRPRAVSFTAVALLAGAAPAQHVESEPNQTKAQAAALGPLLLTAGSTITGTTTGSSTLPSAVGTGNVDMFLIRTAELPAGIYRHRIVVSSAISGHTMTLRATSYAAQDTDEVAQTSSTVSGRRIQWYGFGRSERLYVRVHGDASTTAPYTLTLSTAPVAATPIATTFAPGSMVISSRGLTSFDTEVHVYDGQLAEMRDYQNDDPYMLGGARFELARSFAPGIYYIAAARYNLISTHPEPSRFSGDPTYQGYADSLGGEANPNYSILDFEDGVCTSYSSTTSTPVTFSVADSAGASLVVPAATAAFDIAWFRMEVGGFACVAPSITASPTSLEVCLGNEASFTASGTGTEPLSYQWTWNSVPIPDAHAPTLTIAQVGFDSAGAYACVVSNACGSATTELATLFVHPSGPEITDQPDPLTLCAGEPATFTVAAEGHMGGTLLYQWMKDGAPIEGADAATLQFVVGGLGDGGSYLCRVTETGCGSTDTSAASLTVRSERPVIELVGEPSVNIECGHDEYVERGATVSDDCDAALQAVIGGDEVDSHTLGHYIVTYDATDSLGLAAARVERHVFVVDTEAPTVQATVATPILWSPNHALVDVGLEVQTQDHCSPSATAQSVTVAVYCDESELSEENDGTGRHAPDAKVVVPGALRLRAERRGRGDGRVYVIVVSTRDCSGNTGFGFQTVVCPSAQSQAALEAVRARASAILTQLSFVAEGSERVEDVVAVLSGAGFLEHGLAPERGPHQ